MATNPEQKEKIQPPLKIRRGTREDIPAIKECLINSWVEHAKNEPGLLDEDRMKASNVEGYYGAALDNSNCHVLIAEKDGLFAGFIRGDVQEIPNFFKHNKILFLDDVCVVPMYRKQGVARLLLQEIESIAKEAGIQRLQARVYSFNKPAQNLLREIGYQTPYATWDKVLK